MMICRYKYLLLVFIILVSVAFIQVFLIRYKMKSNLWLSGTNKIIIQENLSQRDKSFTINDENTIKNFEKYLKNTKINYKWGKYFRYYKITLTNGNQKRVYGYTKGNELTDYGKSPGSLKLVVRIYEVDSSFELFIMSIINEKKFDFRSLQKSNSRWIQKKGKDE